jgi:hypothetical protein
VGGEDAVGVDQEEGREDGVVLVEHLVVGMLEEFLLAEGESLPG